MDKQEIVSLDQVTQSVNQTMDRLYAALDGQALSAEVLAQALSRLCPDADLQELEQDCRSLLEGICSGADYAQRLLELPEEELAKVFPEQIRGMLAQMDPEQQHQYLLMLYQYLCQSVGRHVSAEEAIMAANASAEELFAMICDLSQYARAEITCETAETFHRMLRQAAEQPLPGGADRYTQQERMWVLSAAMYAQAREHHPEKIPAALIGEVVGMSGSAGQAFRNCLLQRVIPEAVAVLSVLAVGALVYFGGKALMGLSLFSSAMSWLTAKISPMIIGAVCVAHLLEPVEMLIGEIYQSTYTATAAFTARFLRDEAKEAYLRSGYVSMPGEGLLAMPEETGESDEPVEYEGSGYIIEEESGSAMAVTEEYL